MRFLIDIQRFMRLGRYGEFGQLFCFIPSLLQVSGDVNCVHSTEITLLIAITMISMRGIMHLEIPSVMLTVLGTSRLSRKHSSYLEV